MFSFCSLGVQAAFRCPLAPLPRGGAAAIRRSSGDDVGGNLVFDEGDAVAELQLALLQPLQAEQIGRRRLMQGIDRRVEIAVLLLQPGQFGLQHALVIVSLVPTFRSPRSIAATPFADFGKSWALANL